MDALGSMHVVICSGMDEELNFETKLVFSNDRFFTDENYAYVVSKFIQDRLEALAKEVEELGLAIPRF